MFLGARGTGARSACAGARARRCPTRNQISGTVGGIHTGEVMASVKVKLAGGDVITAAVTAEAVADLGLEAGSPVTVLVKDRKSVV